MGADRFKRSSQERAWADWLSDTPPAPPTHAPESRQARVAQANTYQPRVPDRQPTADSRQPAIAAAAATTPPANVTININLPKLRLPNARQAAQLGHKQLERLRTVPRPALPYKRISIGASVVAGVLVIGVASQQLFFRPSAQQAAAVKAGSSSVGAAVTASAPSFIPVIPKDKPLLASPHNGQAAYDGTRDTYSYPDTVQGTEVTVSEQTLPDKYGSAQEAVSTIAKQLKATQPLTVGSFTAYIKNDSQSHGQIVVYASKGVLIFVQSAFTHNTDSWTSYLNSLQ